MLTLFQVCFLSGLVLVVLAFVLGGLFDIGDMGDFGDFGGIHMGFDIGHFDVGLPTSPLVYITGIITFGGIGWILMISDLHIRMSIIIGISVLAGIIVATPVNYIYKALRKAQNTSSPDNEEIIGLVGTINEKIIENGFGAVSYVFHGNSFEAPAKTKDGSSLCYGTKVRIDEIKDNVFFVSKEEY